MKNQKITHPHLSPRISDGVIAGGFLFISGQASVDFTTSSFVLGTIEEETTRSMNNIKAIAESAGAGMDDIVKCAVHLSDINDFKAFNEVYSKYFTGIKPARTTVQSLLFGNLKVEIDAIVKLP